MKPELTEAQIKERNKNTEDFIASLSDPDGPAREYERKVDPREPHLAHRALPVERRLRGMRDRQEAYFLLVGMETHTKDAAEIATAVGKILGEEGFHRWVDIQAGGTPAEAATCLVASEMPIHLFNARPSRPQEEVKNPCHFDEETGRISFKRGERTISARELLDPDNRRRALNEAADLNHLTLADVECLIKTVDRVGELVAAEKGSAFD